MNAISKPDPEAGANPDMQAILADLASLKHDLTKLAAHVKIGAVHATDGARGAATQLGEDAVHVYDNLRAQGLRSATAIGRQVGEQPVMSLLLACAIGFIGSRLIARSG